MNKKYIKKIVILVIIAIIIGIAAFTLSHNTITTTSKSAEVNGFKLEQNVNYGTAKIVSYNKESKYVK